MLNMQKKGWWVTCFGKLVTCFWNTVKIFSRVWRAWRITSGWLMHLQHVFRYLVKCSGDIWLHGFFDELDYTAESFGRWAVRVCKTCHDHSIVCGPWPLVLYPFCQLARHCNSLTRSACIPYVAQRAHAVSPVAPRTCRANQTEHCFDTLRSLYTEVNKVQFHKTLIIWNGIQIPLIEPVCYLTFMPWLLLRVLPISTCWPIEMPGSSMALFNHFNKAWYVRVRLAFGKRLLSKMKHLDPCLQHFALKLLSPTMNLPDIRSLSPCITSSMPKELIISSKSST